MLVAMQYLCVLLQREFTPQLPATQELPFHVSGEVHALHVGGLFAPLEQEDTPQLLPFQGLPEAQLAVTVFVSKVVPPFFR